MNAVNSNKCDRLQILYRLINIQLATVMCLLSNTVTALQLPLSTTQYACFNTILEMSCDSHTEMLVFESAHYGRNDTDVSVICHVPFTKSCDLDVQHPLTSTCGGRQRCQLAINTAFFGDPCGYDEFLVVTYRCVAVEDIEQRCSAHVQLVEPGFLSTPNYPAKYDMFSDCRYLLTVQAQQTVRLTVFDFELDVKTNGVCRDYLQVSALPAQQHISHYSTSYHHQQQSVSLPRSTMSPRTAGTATGTAGGTGPVVLFRDCGSVGLQVVDVPSNQALIQFHSGQSSLTQRGFLLLFTAVGIGCSLLTRQQSEALRQNVFYYYRNKTLHVNITCHTGFQFIDDSKTDDVQRHVRCLGTTWNNSFSRCTPVSNLKTSNLSASKVKVNDFSFKVTESSTDVFYSDEQRTPSWIFACFVVVAAAVAIGVCTSILTVFYRHRHCLTTKQRKQQQQQRGETNIQDTVISDVITCTDVIKSSTDDVCCDVEECAIYRPSGRAMCSSGSLRLDRQTASNRTQLDTF